MQMVWNAQGVTNLNDFLTCFTPGLKQRLYLDWKGDVSVMDKLDSYRNFKVTLEPERYLFVVSIPHHRSQLSRFRCSSHCLRIETDRKNNIDRNERICPLCSLGEVEDEYHFLLKCPFFDNFRVKFIPLYYFTPPSFQKFIDLLLSKNDHVLKSVAAYLHHSFKLRYEIYKYSE